MSSLLKFVKPVEVLQVTHEGKDFFEDSLGVCIKFPKGAIPKGSQLHLEVGMCLYGPFEFPANTSPIAPILTLCPQESIPLLKPITITLPHIIDQATESDVKDAGIKVLKADHNCLLQGTPDLPSLYVFEDIDSSISFEQIGDENYATFPLLHFCFITLRRDRSIQSDFAKRINITYCISPLYPRNIAAATSEIPYHYPITYYMKPCFEVTRTSYV